MIQKTGRRDVLVVLTTTAVFLFGSAQFVTDPAVEAQGRQTQSWKRSRIPVPPKRGRDYSGFTHESHRSGLRCSSCHTIPSQEQPDRIAAATRPKLVRGYPYHDSCFRCHQQQIYRGNRPEFCTVCNSRVSPRLTARDVYPQFPNPKRGDIIAREFPGYFPHGLHADKVKVECKVCHQTDERGALTLPVRGIQSEETLKEIKEETFKTIPGEKGQSAHKVCFECHWREWKPIKNECNGCHLSASDYETKKNPITGNPLEITTPGAFSANAEKWFQNWPKELPKRFSLKFNHNGGGGDHARKDCSYCHTNIKEMTTLYIPKADVSITICTDCHSKDSPIPVAGGESVTICRELKLKEEPGKNYVCLACHTTLIGREQPPDSHYAKEDLCVAPGPTSREKPKWPSVTRNGRRPRQPLRLQILK